MLCVHKIHWCVKQEKFLPSEIITEIVKENLENLGSALISLSILFPLNLLNLFV